MDEEQAESEKKRLEAENRKDENKKASSARLNEEMAKIDLLIARSQTFGNTKVITATINNLNMDGLRALSDKIRSRATSALIILASNDGGKASFMVSLTDDLVGKGMKAGELAKELAILLNGSGGGRPEFAQGGSKDPSKLPVALEKIINVIKEKIR